MKPKLTKMMLALAAILVTGAALPAGADWLVTREGARVETREAWKVKGKLVVFHTPAGKLSSLRVADLDLDASRRATEEAVAAAAQAAAEPEKVPQRKRSVRVITDQDVQRAEPALEADVPPEGEEAAPARGPASGPGLVVEGWRQERDPEADHVLITGTLQNASSATSVDTRLKILIFDETGTLIASSQAALAKSALPAGERAEFKADFPGYFSFATIKFEPQGRPLARQPSEPPAGGNGG